MSRKRRNESGMEALLRKRPIWILWYPLDIWKFLAGFWNTVMFSETKQRDYYLYVRFWDTMFIIPAVFVSLCFSLFIVLLTGSYVLPIAAFGVCYLFGTWFWTRRLRRKIELLGAMRTVLQIFPKRKGLDKYVSYQVRIKWNWHPYETLQCVLWGICIGAFLGLVLMIG